MLALLEEGALARPPFAPPFLKAGSLVIAQTVNILLFLLVGARLTYADLSLFQVVAGRRYAFPKAMARQAKGCPKVLALHDRVAARPRIAAYLASERRLPFNEQGIFRHYAALDR